MNCDICKKEYSWLDFVGSMILCKKCIGKNKLVGLVHRTNIDAFKVVVRKLKINDYESLVSVSRSDIEGVVNLRKLGIRLKTTNVVELD